MHLSDAKIDWVHRNGWKCTNFHDSLSSSFNPIECRRSFAITNDVRLPSTSYTVIISTIICQLENLIAMLVYFFCDLENTSHRILDVGWFIFTYFVLCGGEIEKFLAVSVACVWNMEASIAQQRWSGRPKQKYPCENKNVAICSQFQLEQWHIAKHMY